TIHAELELSVSDDDALSQSVLGSASVNFKRALGDSLTKLRDHCRTIQMFIVTDYGFGRRRKNRLWQLGTIMQTFGQLNPANHPVILIGTPPCASQVPAYNGFDGYHLMLPYNQGT